MVRHKFREGNRVTNVLAEEGSRQNNYGTISLLQPPVGAQSILQADKEGVATTRKVACSAFAKLALLGNLNLLPKLNMSLVLLLF